MDWIRYDALNDEYLLQHNNLQMMSLEKPAERPQDYQGKCWKVEVEFLYLSVFADWKKKLSEITLETTWKYLKTIQPF